MHGECMCARVSVWRGGRRCGRWSGRWGQEKEEEEEEEEEEEQASSRQQRKKETNKKKKTTNTCSVFVITRRNNHSLSWDEGNGRVDAGCVSNEMQDDQQHNDKPSGCTKVPSPSTPGAQAAQHVSYPLLPKEKKRKKMQ